jgi:hypothetical protein
LESPKLDDMDCVLENSSPENWKPEMALVELDHELV